MMGKPGDFFSKEPGEAMVSNQPRFEMHLDYYREVEVEAEKRAKRPSDQYFHTVLRDAFVDLISEPCVTIEAVHRKLNLMVGDAAMLDQVTCQREMRIFLGSVLCVRDGGSLNEADQLGRIQRQVSDAYENFRAAVSNEQTPVEHVKQLEGKLDAVYWEFLQIPCTSAQSIANKAAFILKHEDLWSEQRAAVRDLFASFLCVKGGKYE